MILLLGLLQVKMHWNGENRKIYLFKVHKTISSEKFSTFVKVILCDFYEIVRSCKRDTESFVLDQIKQYSKYL